MTFTMIYKAPHFKAVSINRNGVTIEYYDIPQEVRTYIKKPLVSVFPNSFSLSYPNSASPSSLHGTFILNIENKGDGKALISEINWKIIDGDRPITPPDEWRRIIGEPEIGKFYLAPHTGMRYLYGPEIGASGKNKILLYIEIKYTNPLEKDKTIHIASYSGTISYDTNLKMKYSGNEFVAISSHDSF